MNKNYLNRYKLRRSTNDKTLKASFSKRSLIIDTLKKSTNPSLFKDFIVQKRESIANVSHYMNLAKKAESTPSADADDDVTAKGKNDSTVTNSAVETTNDQVPHKKKVSSAFEKILMWSYQFRKKL